jgi:hypothetical protein
VAGGDRKNADAALITALASGATVARAAEQAGVSERTVWRRLQADDFRARLDMARQQSIQMAVDYLGKASSAAALTLADLLAATHPPSARLGAARAILELGVKLRESQELEERLAALEAALAEQEPASGQRRQPWAG